MSNPSNTREELVDAVRRSQHWDLIIIGGGATGLGTAVEAVTRGYKTLLLEQYDFAKGTSSRSTKLVHGGVRYLAQGNIKLVQSALRERGRLRRNAPHLVKDLTFLVPAYSWWAQPYYGAGLKLYDWLAGRLNLGSSRFLSRAEALQRMPTLKTKGLKGAILYHDGQFDDARLAITLLRTFIAKGGTALNYCPVQGLLKENNRITGVIAVDQETGEKFECSATVVVNATGVFVDTVRRMDNPTQSKLLAPSQGIHLVVDRRFQPSDSAMMIPKTEDGRVLFAVPWHDKVVLGTTDTPVQDVAIEPRPLESEIDFILRTAAQYLATPPTRDDVLSVFVGQRPLVKSQKSDGVGSTATLSREHIILVSESGLITVTGGKWTTYREMGEEVVDRAVQTSVQQASVQQTSVQQTSVQQKTGGNAIAPPLSPSPSVTANLHLQGWTEQLVTGSLSVYGSDAAQIQRLPGADQLLHPDLFYTEAEVRWAARYELARTVEDVLARRTRALFLDAAASLACAPRVAQILAEELGFDATWQQQQVEAYGAIAAGYQLSVNVQDNTSSKEDLLSASVV
ncbi:MAG: glycerol-3-phosphate dehydrogenase/oxidase [Oculatellaceae cyanobacterium Prado106]|jgi:glycerol-3-phosphate dehydrogenase|nr:glycerol-3-phosphate dehydrogenase/oxidase [Oculatellaceae cyanobacterium Prado106]